MFTAGPNGGGWEKPKRSTPKTTDPDAARRQAIVKLSTAMMNMRMLQSTNDLPEIVEVVFKEIFEDLTDARFLLTEVCDPENVLDELAGL